VHRRNFIHLSGASLGSLFISSYLYSEGKKIHTIKLPDSISIQTDEGWISLLSVNQNYWENKEVAVELQPVNDTLLLQVRSPSSALKTIRLVWKYPIAKTVQMLGDHWERTYGDMQWKNTMASAKMPWYVIQHSEEGNTNCIGVKTGCNTICYWQAAIDGLTLSLDTKSGGDGVRLGGRTLQAAQIIATKNEGNENVFATSRRFCKMMCEKPRTVAQPVYGINDWYFAYGNNSADLILLHTSLISTLITDSSNRPFSVIDAGWAVKSPLLPDDCCWGDDFGRPNSKFGDMGNLAEKIKTFGMRPGLWTRPLCASYNESRLLLMPAIKNRNDPKNTFLDPTIDENLERIKNYIITYKHWGYEMVKHDYTTYDILGRWGFEMTDDITESNWHFNDNSRTNAEIILQVYRSIREAAGDTYLIGCNTMSHLSAGLFELNRIGDDTSGNDWTRTRKMGVNTLAFRMMQHGNFYQADGDCVGLTKKIPWEKNKQWMQLLAQSSTPLFISAQPDAVGEEQKQYIKQSFVQCARQQPVGEPLDWLTNLLPSQWKLNGKEVVFDWN
jgi:alpha-galactosidase